MYLLKSDDVFVKETAKECLNFAITVLLVYIVLGISIIGISLMPLLWLVTVVLYVLAAKGATEGQIFRFSGTKTVRYGAGTRWAYRSVRTALQFATSHGVPQTLLITSSSPGASARR